MRIEKERGDEQNKEIKRGNREEEKGEMARKGEITGVERMRRKTRRGGEETTKGQMKKGNKKRRREERTADKERQWRDKQG